MCNDPRDARGSIVSVRLKRVNLMLHEDLHSRLKLEARHAGTSMSDLVRRLLVRGLGMTESPYEAVQRIRRVREVLGKMPDSEPVDDVGGRGPRDHR